MIRMLKKKKAAIFDLDGTLMDSMWMWRDIDIEYLGRFQISPPENLQVEIEGMGFTETAVYFKETFALPDSIEKIKADWNQMAYEKYAHQVPLKKGAYRLLEELRRQGIKLGIATSNHIELVRAALRNNGVEEWFDCIRTSCDVAKGKPAPDVYLSVAEALKVAPGDCIVFEDVPMGVLAGLNAGMTVCAIQDPFSGEREEAVRSLAHYFIHDYDEVLNQTYEVLR